MTLAAALLFLVTSSADSGAGSLRGAIAWANTMSVLRENGRSDGVRVN